MRFFSSKFPLVLFLFIFGFVCLVCAQKEPVKAGTETDVNLNQPQETTSFSIALIADRTGGWQEDIKYLRRAVYEINQLNPDFTIHIGDMVEGYTRDIELWKQQSEEFRNIMNELKVPWYPTPGNHDVISGSRAPDDKTFENLYKKYFGPLYYSFDYKNSHFICLYTDEALQSKVYFSERQIDWLKEDLENTDKTNIFVYMHKPVWNEYYRESGWEDIHEILKEYPVRAVIAGHFHSYRKCPTKDEIQYYILGATGGNLYEKVELGGQFNHYNILRIKDDTFTMGVVKLGNVESDDYVAQEDADNIRRLVTQRYGTEVDGWLWQPIYDEVKGTVSFKISNPLDTEIDVDLVDCNNNSHWISQPYKSAFLLEPNSAVSAKVELYSSITPPEYIMPPKFIVRYFYRNKKNRIAVVPVKLWVPLRASCELTQHMLKIDIDGELDERDWHWKDEVVLYPKSWVPSHYEREEEPAPFIHSGDKVMVPSHYKPRKKLPAAVHIMADESYLYFCAVVTDEVYEYYYDENRSDRLLSDYIVFAADDNGDTNALLIFPFSNTKRVFKCGFPNTKISKLEMVEGIDYATSKEPDKNLYTCEGKIGYDKLFGTTEVAGKEFLFNVGIVDNDKSAFTYLKSWAYAEDKAYWGIVKFNAKN